MQNAAAGWHMTELVSSALPVALLQTATSLPFLLVGLPSGALADVVDRRRLLVGSHLWLGATAAALAALTAAGQASPWLLLGLTLSIGFGTAANNPASLATMTDVLPRAEIAGAMTLASAAFNAARAAGPPVAGALLALASPAAAYGVVAAIFLAVALVIARLELPPRPARAPGPQPSLRRLLAIAAFRAVLARTALFIAGASALWALLPVIAVEQLGLGPQGFGGLLGLIGTGAVLGALAMAPLRARLSIEALTVAGTVLFACASALLAVPSGAVPAALLMLALGFGWLATRSTLTVAAQLTAPASVRGRAFAAQLLVWHSGQAVGGIGWALVAQRLGLPTALLGSGLLLCAGLGGTRRLRLPDDA